MSLCDQDAPWTAKLKRQFEEAAGAASLLEALLNDPKRDINWYHDVARQVQEINAALPFVEAIDFNETT